MSTLRSSLFISESHRGIIGYALFGACCMAAAILSEQLFWAFIPFIPLGAAIAIARPRIIYGLLLISIPLAYELRLSPSLGTDMPSEPLMWLVACLVLVQGLLHPSSLPFRLVTHPIALALWAWMSWSLLTSMTAGNPMISVKWLFAKVWYILCFFIGPLIYTRRIHEVRKILSYVLIVLSLLCLVVVLRHAVIGFSFADVNSVLGNFRNHVVYAAILVVMLPYIFFMRSGSSSPWGWTVLFLFLAIAMILAFTRAAYLALIGSMGWYFIIRYRLTAITIGAAALIAVGAVFYLIQDNTFMSYAPQYEKTVTHYTLEDIMSATTDGTDVSSMERVYRWVAGYQMIQRRPWMGYGPNNFVSHYERHTVDAFKTYVSDNRERSGMHCYYLLTTVEQGYPGLILFILIQLLALLYAERVYHRLQDPRARSLLLSATLSLVAIMIMQLLNELIETDKIGPLWYVSLATIIALDLNHWTADAPVDISAAGSSDRHTRRSDDIRFRNDRP